MDGIPSHAYVHPITICEADIDTMHHVNNVVYLRWILEASEQDWNSKTTVEIRSKYGWMIRRHEIDYLQQARLGDDLVAYTWPEDPDALKIVRHVHIVNRKTGKLITKCSTVWIMFDLQTLRPVAFPEDLKKLFAG